MGSDNTIQFCCSNCGNGLVAERKQSGQTMCCLQCSATVIVSDEDRQVKPAPMSSSGQISQPASSDFDPYHKWLAIPPEEQPPDHYRLLACKPFETDPDVIANAVDARMIQVKSFQTSKYATLSQQILNELAAARVCLLNPQKKAEYDRVLKQERTKLRPVPPAPPVIRSPVAPDETPPIIAESVEKADRSPAGKLYQKLIELLSQTWPVVKARAMAVWAYVDNWLRDRVGEENEYLFQFIRLLLAIVLVVIFGAAILWFLMVAAKIVWIVLTLLITLIPIVIIALVILAVVVYVVWAAHKEKSKRQREGENVAAPKKQ